MQFSSVLSYPLTPRRERGAVHFVQSLARCGIRHQSRTWLGSSLECLGSAGRLATPKKTSMAVGVTRFAIIPFMADFLRSYRGSARARPIAAAGAMAPADGRSTGSFMVYPPSNDQCLCELLPELPEPL